MLDQFSRTRLLLGDDGMERLKASRVAVVGSGLAAAFAAEALVRSGVGSIDIYGDADRERLLDINPEVIINIYPAEQEAAGEYDYIINIPQEADNTLPHENMKAGLIAAGDAIRWITRR